MKLSILAAIFLLAVPAYAQNFPKPPGLSDMEMAPIVAGTAATARGAVLGQLCGLRNEVWRDRALAAAESLAREAGRGTPNPVAILWWARGMILAGVMNAQAEHKANGAGACAGLAGSSALVFADSAARR